jgi:hypothetical protein
MKTEPKDGKTTKKVKDVKYHWCPHHKLWQKHKPADCRLNPTNRNNNNNNANQRGNDRPNEARAEGNQANENANANNNNRRMTFAPASTIAVSHADDVF